MTIYIYIDYYLILLILYCSFFLHLSSRWVNILIIWNKFIKTIMFTILCHMFIPFFLLIN
eukprot:UN00838